MTRFLRLITGTMTAMGILLCPAASVAQADYPNKPIRLIIGFPPGGSTDIVGRIVAMKLSERLGQQVIVDNRGGAGGTIGAELASKATPDGYTLTIGTTSTHAAAAGAYSKLPYDPIKNFAPVSLVAITPYLLVVNELARRSGQPCEKSAGQTQLCLGRQRLDHPPCDGNAQGRGQDQPRAHTL